MPEGQQRLRTAAGKKRSKAAQLLRAIAERKKRSKRAKSEPRALMGVQSQVSTDEVTAQLNLAFARMSEDAAVSTANSVRASSAAASESIAGQLSKGALAQMNSLMDSASVQSELIGQLKSAFGELRGAAVDGLKAANLDISAALRQSSSNSSSADRAMLAEVLAQREELALQQRALMAALAKAQADGNENEKARLAAALEKAKQNLDLKADAMSAEMKDKLDKLAKELDKVQKDFDAAFTALDNLQGALDQNADKFIHLMDLAIKSGLAKQEDARYVYYCTVCYGGSGCVPCAAESRGARVVTPVFKDESIECIRTTPGLTCAQMSFQPQMNGPFGVRPAFKVCQTNGRMLSDSQVSQAVANCCTAALKAAQKKPGP